MAASSSSTPRSVADATRFTANTPHASTKSTPAAAAATTTSRPLNSPKVSPSPQQSKSPLPRRGGSMGPAQQESPEERVRRLRAAHLAAKQHSISRLDRLIGSSRQYFDAAHKFTVMGLIGFSGLALIVTLYATADMLMYNRKRRAEFFAVQKQLKEDSLEAARLAYMTGTASEEQIILVEDATAKAKESGIGLPPILSSPRSAAPPDSTREATTTSTATADRTIWPGESMTESSLSGAAETTQQKKGGITGWLFSGLKSEDTATVARRRTSENADAEALSTSDEKWRTPTSTTAALATDALRDKAKAAFEQEKDNQRHGGPLDQVGLDDGAATTAPNAATSGESKKKGWGW